MSGNPTEVIPVSDDRAKEIVKMFNFSEPYLDQSKQYKISSGYYRKVGDIYKREYPKCRFITNEIVLNNFKSGIPPLFDPEVTNEKYILSKQYMPTSDNDSSRSKFKIVYDANQKSCVDMASFLSIIDTNVHNEKDRTWGSLERLVNEKATEEAKKTDPKLKFGGAGKTNVKRFMYNSIVNVSETDSSIVYTKLGVPYRKSDDIDKNVDKKPDDKKSKYVRTFDPNADIIMLQTKNDEGEYVKIPCKNPTDIYNAVPINSIVIIIFEIGYGWWVGEKLGVRIILSGIRVIEKGDRNSFSKIISIPVSENDFDIGMSKMHISTNSNNMIKDDKDDKDDKESTGNNADGGDSDNEEQVE